jgi:hypothetical protein
VAKDWSKLQAPVRMVMNLLVCITAEILTDLI